MPNKYVAIVLAAVLTAVAGALVVMRRTRTDAPPVSPTVPRVQDVVSPPATPIAD